MPLQSSGAISMNDMRSEFGFGSSSISMSQLYRGGSYVDTEQARTDIISSVSDSGFGQSGYSKRFNYGNLNNWSFGTTTSQNYYGGRFIYQMGYLYNGQTGSSDLQSLDSSNAGGTRTEAAYYMYNGAAKDYDSGAVLYYACTHGMSSSSPHTLNVTFAVAGTYYIFAGQPNAYPYDQGYRYSISGASSGNVTDKYAYSYTEGNTAGSFGVNGSTITVTANQTVTFTMLQTAQSIQQFLSISTKNDQWNSRVAQVNTGVPSSGQISFSELYGAT